MQIENKFLKITFKNEASEWTSFFDKEQKIEYAWQGKPEFWAGRNPTLFPVVGKVWKETYRIKDVKFHLGNHGLARNSIFQLVEQTGNSLTLRLTDTEESRKQYPFSFELQNHYLLDNKTLQITTTVTNRDREVLPFAIGAHPAFNCPLLPGEKFEDYRIILEKSEDLRRLKMNPDSSFQKEIADFGRDVKEIPLTRDLFREDALVLENLKSRWVRLQGPQSAITVTNNNCPWFGIWTKGKAPFICLEPWQGHGDFENYLGDFTLREGMILLPPGMKYDFHYQIKVD